jgi:hypothetical protein
MIPRGGSISMLNVDGCVSMATLPLVPARDAKKESDEQKQ